MAESKRVGSDPVLGRSGVARRSATAPTGYIVDICRYCGRMAVWPGCEHWQTHAGWTLSVRVAPTPAGLRTIQAEMDKANGSAFCQGWVESEGDPWGGTDCKLPAHHDGPCSPLYADERGVGVDA